MAEAGDHRPSGFLVLDKPAGISSAKALVAIKRGLPPGTKVGHAGTLDPFATGVLVVLVGSATRQSERVMRLPKGYAASLRLGATTPTLDPESPEVPFKASHAAAAASNRPAAPSRDEVERTLARFVGHIEQIPPAFSALKVGGKRAYALARAGGTVQLRPRMVMVHRLELVSYQWPDLQLFLECSRGFYVRSLARDIGEALGTGAYLSSLRRTFVGPFNEALAAPPGVEAVELLAQEWLDRRAANG